MGTRRPRAAWPLGPAWAVLEGWGSVEPATFTQPYELLELSYRFLGLPGIRSSMITRSVHLTHAGDQSGAGVSREGELLKALESSARGKGILSSTGRSPSLRDPLLIHLQPSPSVRGEPHAPLAFQRGAWNQVQPNAAAIPWVAMGGTPARVPTASWSYWGQERLSSWFQRREVKGWRCPWTPLPSRGLHAEERKQMTEKDIPDWSPDPAVPEPGTSRIAERRETTPRSLFCLSSMVPSSCHERPNAFQLKIHEVL